MSAFDDLNTAAQSFAETSMGEDFTYVSPTGVTTSGLRGVFNQVTQDFQFSEFSTKLVTVYTVVSSKAWWGAAYPENNGTVTDSSGVSYNVNGVSGINSAGEPAFEIAMNKLT